jgi:branched-chain amino acid aminotransferase
MFDLINLNGRLSNERSFDSLVYNRGLTYGDAIFETIRVCDGYIPLWDHHWQRISESLQFLDFPNHEILHKDKLRIEILRQVDNKGNARIKLIIFRTGLGKYAPKLCKTEYLIITKPLKGNLPIWKENGIHIDISEKSVLPAGAPYGFIKKTAAMPYILADREKEEKQLDELILRNTNNQLSECIYHNLFIFKNGKYQTPPLSSGCVMGTMRQFLLKYMRDNQIPFEEKELTHYDLMDSEEVFLTNAVQFITPVSLFNHKVKYSLKHSRELFEEIVKELMLIKV